MDNKYVISLEIGSSAVQVVAAAYNPVEPGPLTIIGAAEAPLVNCVRYGRVQNVKQVAHQTLMALDSLRENPELADREVVGVYTSLGGRSLHSLTAEAQLTFTEETCVTDDIIDRLKDQAVENVNQDVEIYDVIPVSYTVDSMATANPVGVYVKEIKARFTVVVCKNMNIRNLERVLEEQLALEICGTIVRPLAIADLCLTRDETRPGCMLVDLGAETTTVSIYREGALVYLATIPLGGAHVTRDIAAARGITEEQAEATKCNMASAMIDASAPNAEIRDINNHAHARAIEIVANILAQIEYAGLTPSHLRAGIIITGRGARLRNFCKLLEAQSGMKVRAAAIPATIHMASADLKAADLLAPIAVAAVAARLADDPMAIPCLTESVYIPGAVEEEPQEKPYEDEVDAVAADVAVAPQPVTEPSAQTPPGQAPVNEDPKPHHQDIPDQPRRRTPAGVVNGFGIDDDDPYVLLDDEEADKKRREELRRKDEARIREAEKAAAHKAAEEEKKRRAAQKAAQKAEEEAARVAARRSKEDALRHADADDPEGPADLELPDNKPKTSFIDMLRRRISSLVEDVDAKDDNSTDL